MFSGTCSRAKPHRRNRPEEKNLPLYIGAMRPNVSGFTTIRIGFSGIYHELMVKQDAPLEGFLRDDLATVWLVVNGRDEDTVALFLFRTLG
jgi:hypothetical protein